MIGNVCRIAAEALAQGRPDGSVVIALSRAGTAALTASERHILRELQHGARTHGAPVRMLCRATTEGAFELGPAASARPQTPGSRRQ